MTGFAAHYAALQPRPSRRQRAAGAALVVLLHGLLLLAALHAVIRSPPRPSALRETILRLSVLPPPVPKTQALPSPNAPPLRAIVLPPSIAIPPPVAAPSPAPDVTGLGQSLFGCAPENLGKLSEEQRAHCGGSGIAPADGLVVGEPPSHVKNPELRAAEMQKRNTPMTVPCVTIQTRALGNSYQEHILMVDPVCAAKELKN